MIDSLISRNGEGLNQLIERDLNQFILITLGYTMPIESIEGFVNGLEMFLKIESAYFEIDENKDMSLFIILEEGTIRYDMEFETVRDWPRVFWTLWYSVQKRVNTILQEKRPVNPQLTNNQGG